jgi:HlyD family secretion protein
MKLKQAPKPNLNYRRPAIFAFAALLVLAGGGATWASFANISGAVLTNGSIVVRGQPKSIQHPQGGVVQAINVEAGDTVNEGDVLVELDSTQIQANLAIYERRLRDALVRQARLLAELQGEETFSIDSVQAELGENVSLDEPFSKQTALMQAREQTRLGQYQQLDEQVAQLGNQRAGLTGLLAEKVNQIAALQSQIDSTRTLVERGLSARSQLLALEGQFYDLRGQTAEFNAELGRIENQVSEVRISKLQVDRAFREAVIVEIEKNDASIEELRQQIAATSTELDRLDIRSPVSGIVHESTLFTIGGVVPAGQTVMQIVPQTAEFDIALNVDVQSVDQLYIGQKAVIRLPAFNQRTTPELFGKIISISPSSVIDETTGLAFYRAKVGLDEGELARLGDKVLIPGMPAEGMLPTDERSALSFLVKPLTDQMNRAFREE